MTDMSEFSLVFVSSDNFLYSEVSRRCPDKMPQSDTLKSYLKIPLGSSPSVSLYDSKGTLFGCGLHDHNDKPAFFFPPAHLLFVSVEGLQLQRCMLLLCQLQLCQREVYIRHVLHTHLDVLPVGVQVKRCMSEVCMGRLGGFKRLVQLYKREPSFAPGKEENSVVTGRL